MVADRRPTPLGPWRLIRGQWGRWMKDDTGVHPVLGPCVDTTGDLGGGTSRSGGRRRVWTVRSAEGVSHGAHMPGAAESVRRLAARLKARRVRG